MARRPRGGRRLIASPRARRTLALLALLAPFAVAACRAPRASDDIVSTWIVDPMTPRSGDLTRVNVVLRTRAGEPVRGATLQMAAHMSHPGMAPIVADAVETVPGSYGIVLRWTMAGDWTVVASGTLPDGRRITRSVDVGNVR